MSQSLPGREVFWNISNHFILYILLAITLVIFGYGVYRRIRLWRLGTKENRTDQPGRRIKAILQFALAHARILRESYPGFMHIALFTGFLLLLIGTATVSFDYDVWKLLLGQASFLKGDFYLIFSLILDLAGLFAFAGILIAIFRRYIQKPGRLNNQVDDALFLFGLLFIIIGGFLVEGTRIAGTAIPEWEVWSPVGFWLSGFFTNSGESTIRLWHQAFWWSHLVAAFGFIAYIPYSKLFHMLSSPANIYFQSFRSKGELLSMDLETAETFGATKIDDFSWKHLLDLDACTRCGRCQDNCPAYLSNKPLSPKKIILDLLDNLDRKGPELLKKKQDNSEELPEPLVGTAVQADEIWACTTCRACMEACPVFIEHIDKIIDLRRERVLMESDFPAELQQTFKGMENNSNPWGIGLSKRADWAEGLNIKNAAEEQVEYLWFVGCAGSFDDRVKKVSVAFNNIMNAAGLSFGILGTEENCCGETARRLGNEYLAQTMMETNVEMFNSLGVKKIVTFCPHCFNTFKNEYPQFKGNYEVIHHTQLIAELIRSGKIKLKPGNGARVTFHDSCYLGRYADIYDDPRYILNHTHNKNFVEIKARNKDKSFCCGAGGGRMWLEETIGTRINHMRTDQIIETGASACISACPYCLTMFSDGIKDKEMVDKMKAMDIAEIVANVLGD